MFPANSIEWHAHREALAGSLKARKQGRLSPFLAFKQQGLSGSRHQEPKVERRLRQKRKANVFQITTKQEGLSGL